MKRHASATCIYCVESKPATAFSKAEHVLPQSFGRFKGNLTLRGVVCDDCNHFFGSTIELYLARDTPDGLNRYLIGGKDPEEFKSLGKNSSLVTRADSGPLKGALVAQRIVDGKLGAAPLPQIGLGKTDGGPYDKWFTVDALPTRDELQGLIREGYRYVHFCEIFELEPVLAALRERGMPLSDVEETRPAGWRSLEKFETRALLGMEFGRAITKIAFNYLAHEYGAGTALMAEFNTARHFVRHGGKLDERRIWDPLPPKEGRWPLAHRIGIQWDQRSRSATAEIVFHNSSWYRVTLATDLLVVPTENRAHVFDLKSMTVRRIT